MAAKRVRDVLTRLGASVAPNAIHGATGARGSHNRRLTSGGKEREKHLRGAMQTPEFQRPSNFTIDLTPASRCSAGAGHRGRYVADKADWLVLLCH